MIWKACEYIAKRIKGNIKGQRKATPYHKGQQFYDVFVLYIPLRKKKSCSFEVIRETSSVVAVVLIFRYWHHVQCLLRTLLLESFAESLVCLTSSFNTQ